MMLTTFLEFIEANRQFWTSDNDKNVWNTLFRTALKFEIGLFDSVLVQTPDFAAVPLAAIHGNCVFSDAEHPVEVFHLSGRAVVWPCEVGNSISQGKIHFPLGQMPGLSVAWTDHGPTGAPNIWLQVDCDQVVPPGRRVIEGVNETDGRGYGDKTRIVKAEIYFGCSLVASKDLIPPKIRSFRESLNRLSLPRPDGVLNGPKGWEVTLTLEFGQIIGTSFCSVAVSVMP